MMRPRILENTAGMHLRVLTIKSKKIKKYRPTSSINAEDFGEWESYISLVIVACIINFERALSLLLLTIVGIVFISWDKLISKYEDRITQIFHPYKRRLEQQEHWLKWVLYIALIAAVICWLVFDTANQGTRQLISFGGLLMYIALMFIFSKHPTKISWRTVFSGVGLQFVFGVFILRTQIGYDAFAWSGKQMETFLQYSNVGSEFVFGEKYTDHFFAFKVLPIVVFFSMITSILYYIGFMQWIILKVGWIMQLVMATSPTESVVAAGNIFIGQSEAPLIIRPYLQQLTKSEIHAVMTGGFATIAGSVLGAYIQAGVPASHLLTASVMSAPASLAVAKLCWPETDTPKITRKGFKMEKREEKNILEAASHGASLSIPLVANIAVNLIAFLSLLAFLNSALSWLGNMFDYPQFSFSVICSYIFMPFSFMMGVDWNDSFLVGELIGYKTFFNEFLAYNKLAEMIKKRQAGGPEYSGEIKQYLSAQSEVIATYALCGFANFGSLGVQIGALSSLAPKRRSDISSCALRSLISGTIACFMTACVAGMLYIPEEALTCPFVLDNTFNSNLSSIINTTDLAKCCTVLFESAFSTNSSQIVFNGSYTLTSLRGCCTVIDSLLFNCSLVTI
ncbi:solute carrier family 28 member 3-like [Polypterus senegalus]|uniref:solute carrier family 28 member 3-like n=1 Tax=Polypterus senegalus TaxID=55291 RepID=UPI001962DE3C|nr:solute carrier family 28 member 3-like [Polypterus senegalus]